MTQLANRKDNLGWLLWESCKAGDSLTDFTIRCGDQAFRVHKCILSCRSSVFKAKCEGALKARKTEFHLHSAEPNILECALEFIYTSNYPLRFTTTSPDRSNPKKRSRSLSHHARMYEFANNFDIPELGLAAKGAYFSRMRLNAKSLMCSQDSNSSRIAPLALGILESIPIAFNSTPDGDRGLRDEIIQQFKSLGPTIQACKNAEVCSVFRKILHEEQKFKDELLMGFLEAPDSNRCGERTMEENRQRKILERTPALASKREVLLPLKPNDNFRKITETTSGCTKSCPPKRIDPFKSLLDHWETRARTLC